MYEVEALRGLENVLDAYQKHYRVRYGVSPVIANRTEASLILKELIRAAGETHTLRLIAKYLSMNGDQDWFVRKGHSIEELKRNLSAVNAALGTATRPGASTGLRVSTIVACDHCFKDFNWVGAPNDLEAGNKKRACPKCTK